MNRDLTGGSVLSLQSIKAIIFDCDGTLVDSEEAHLAAWQQVAKVHGFDLSLAEYLTYVGSPDLIFARMIADRVNHDSPEMLLAQKRAHFAIDQKKGLPPITETIVFLRRLIQENAQWGLKLAVASAALKHEILLNLKALQLENVFDVILSGQDDLHEYQNPDGVNKPQPYIYLHAAKLLGVSPSECIVIEDSHTGVTAGARAGCFTIAVPNAFSKHQDFSPADLILGKLSDFSVSRFLETAMASKVALSYKLR